MRVSQWKWKRGPPENAWTQRNGAREGFTVEGGSAGTTDLGNTGEASLREKELFCVESQMFMKHPRREDNKKLQTSAPRLRGRTPPPLRGASVILTLGLI